jgi:hypothetical protein
MTLLAVLLIQHRYGRRVIVGVNDLWEGFSMRSKATVIALVLAMFSCASVAVAQGPAGNAYGGEGAVLGEVESETDGTGSEEAAGTPRDETAGNPNGEVLAATSSGSGDGSSSLPFTGFDVPLLLVGGIVLIGAGALIRRLTPAVPKR